MKNSYLFIAIALAWSCSTTKNSVVIQDETQTELLDTLYVSATDPEHYDDTPIASEIIAELPIYQESFKRTIDILHTRLDLRFDYEKEYVLGVANIKLKPLFYNIDEVILDAKNFDIHKITMDQGLALKYDYNGKQIKIYLDREYKSAEVINLIIDYTAKPSEGEMGGSQAISQDKGLYFIDPRNEDPFKPTQIWTQGETESNSRWFPTVDKPNERCTQEMYVTVDDKYVTLSNGIKISSTKNADGTRTDYWKMDQPHAPYLFMLAIGDFAVVEDSWKGKDVSYYVEPKFEKDAKSIFLNTKEMLTYFSDLLGVEYPWPSYNQVVVRDYVSGAMENTTAVIYGEFVQKDTRSLIDNTNERIVAHEMFHHWFGDLVTCESWSNLTMNEGFANYSEYLWQEKKYGRDAADFHRMNDHYGYVGSTLQGGIHDLINFEYEKRESMFDAHSYNKGGLVLHRLRSYLGDKAFFAGLKLYLNDNAYSAVEAHDLRLAMEEISGEDLNWFFNQWFFAAGHPDLSVINTYSPESKSITIELTQNQLPENGQPAIFELPIDIDIYVEGQEVRRERIRMNKRNQSFSFDVTDEPSLVNVDANRVHIGVMKYDKTDNEYLYQFYNAPLFADRLEAIQNIAQTDLPQRNEVMLKALDDPFWHIRDFALSQLPEEEDAVLSMKIDKMAKSDPHSAVRGAALGYLTSIKGPENIKTLEYAIDHDQAYPVINDALSMIAQLDIDKAVKYAEKFEKQNVPALMPAIANVYAATGSAEYLPFFHDGIEKTNGFESFDFLNSYSPIYMGLSDMEASKEIDFIAELATSSSADMMKKLALVKNLFDVKNILIKDNTKVDLVDKINAHTEKIMATETNPVLSSYYKQFGG